jgi:hypothetical protein
MAEVIREGDKNLLKATTWQDFIKMTMLEQIYKGSKYVPSIQDYLLQDELYNYLRVNFKHLLMQGEISIALQEMYKDGWIAPFQYTCECCKGKQHPPEEILRHVVAFEVTQKGRDLIS